MRVVLALAVVMLAGCAGGAPEPVVQATPVALKPGDVANGKVLFRATCVYCHNERGFGTRMIKARLGDREAVLEARSDLPPEFVKVVVRNGMGAMPWYTRVELSDQDLQDVTAYLAAPKAAAGGAR